jgi:hypothetical protein
VVRKCNPSDTTYSLDSDQDLEDEVTSILILDLKTVDIVGDVVDQAGEEGDLEVLVELDQLKVGDALIADLWWSTTIRQCAVSEELNLLQLLVAGVWEPVGEGEVAGA